MAEAPLASKAKPPPPPPLCLRSCLSLSPLPQFAVILSCVCVSHTINQPEDETEKHLFQTYLLSKV